MDENLQCLYSTVYKGYFLTGGHLHDDVILLLLPSPSGFCFLVQIAKERTKCALVLVVRRRHRANGLSSSETQGQIVGTRLGKD